MEPRVFRPAPPPAPCAVRWLGGFGQRFTIFVDTEEEFDWFAPLSRDARSVAAIAAIPAATTRFADSGAALTFLVDHPVATDPAAIAAMRRALEVPGTAIGTQLHPWVNPPFDEAMTRANSFVGNLPPALEAAKLDVLGDAIVAAFGGRPQSYRAGRYGIGAATIALLAARGYRIDTSMRSRYDYSAEGGPDFTGIGNEAFWADAEGRIAELPLTSVYIGGARRGGAALERLVGRLPRGRSLLARTRLLARIALTPEDMPLADALEAVRIAAGEGLALLNFSFHSPSLVPGHTPYVRDAAELAAFWRWWDAVLALLARLGVGNAREADLLEALGSAALAPAGPAA